MSKEWKGNKKSVSTMLGMSTTWHPEQRAAGENIFGHKSGKRSNTHWICFMKGFE